VRVLVAPGADDPAGPAGIGEQAGCVEFVGRVAVAAERGAKVVGRRDQAERGLGDSISGDAALDEVAACVCAAFAGEFVAADDERVVQQPPPAVGWRRSVLDRSGVDAGAFGEVVDGVDEIASAGGAAVV